MGIYIALLRGINVGGKNKLPMKDLVTLMENAGCLEVQTYIQSGNAVFESTSAIARTLPDTIAESIAEQFGLTVPVILRTTADIGRVVQTNPFLKPGVDTKALHVAFLAGKPGAKYAAALDPKRSSGDEFKLKGREIYLHCPNGVARTKLTTAYFDATLGTISSMRNWNTVLKLNDLALTRIR